MLAVAPEAADAGRGGAHDARAAARGRGGRAAASSCRRATRPACLPSLRPPQVRARRPRDWSHHGLCVRVRTWTHGRLGAVVERHRPALRRTTVTTDGAGAWASRAGLTRRANSALPPDPRPPTSTRRSTRWRPCTARLACRRRSASARRRAVPRCATLLLARGYAPVSGADVLVRAVDGPSAHVGGGVDVQVAAHPDDAWLAAWIRREERGRRRGDGARDPRRVARDLSDRARRCRWPWSGRHSRRTGSACPAWSVVTQARREGSRRALTPAGAGRSPGRAVRAGSAFLRRSSNNTAAARLGLGFAPADAYKYLARRSALEQGARPRRLAGGRCVNRRARVDRGGESAHVLGGHRGRAEHAGLRRCGS